jgi:fluoride ion exporter CrcB/FEX
VLAGKVAFSSSSSEYTKLFWITGFAGALTTFSSLSFFIAELPPFEALFYAGVTTALSLVILAAMRKEQAK